MIKGIWLETKVVWQLPMMREVTGTEKRNRRRMNVGKDKMWRDQCGVTALNDLIVFIKRKKITKK